MNLVGMITRTHLLPFGTRPSWVNTNVGTCGCGGRAMESRKHRCTCSTARQGGTTMTHPDDHAATALCPTFHCQRIEGASALPDISCTSSFPQTKRKFADGVSRGPPPIPMRPCLLFSQKKRKGKVACLSRSWWRVPIQSQILTSLDAAVAAAVRARLGRWFSILILGCW